MTEEVREIYAFTPSAPEGRTPILATCIGNVAVEDSIAYVAYSISHIPTGMLFIDGITSKEGAIALARRFAEVAPATGELGQPSEEWNAEVVEQCQQILYEWWRSGGRAYQDADMRFRVWRHEQEVPA